MASVRPRGKRFMGLYSDASGKQKSAGTYDTYDEALARAKIAELDAKPLEYPEVHPRERRGKVTVAAYAPKWLDGLLVEPNTRLAYGLSLKHIIVCIGGAAMADVDGDDIRKIIRHMEKLGLADNTIRHALVVADLMFASAVPKLRDDNPATDVKKKFKVRDQREMQFATREQAKAIEDAIPERYKLLVRALFATGCRWGEMIAVKGTDIEKRGTGHVLKIRRTVGETSGVGVYLRNYGKSVKAKRDITIPEALARELMKFGDKPCFATTKGTWPQRSDFRQHAWKPAVEAAGIPSLRIHDSRHSHASWLANDPRVPLAAVRDRLGHTSLTTPPLPCPATIRALRPSGGSVNAITWQQTPDRRTWRAARGLVLLTVTKLSSGMFRADVEGPGVTERSPEFRTRLAAQSWADNRAGVSK